MSDDTPEKIGLWAGMPEEERHNLSKLLFLLSTLFYAFVWGVFSLVIQPRTDTARWVMYILMSSTGSVAMGLAIFSLFAGYGWRAMWRSKFICLFMAVLTIGSAVLAFSIFLYHKPA